MSVEVQVAVSPPTPLERALFDGAAYAVRMGDHIKIEMTPTGCVIICNDEAEILTKSELDNWPKNGKNPVILAINRIMRLR